VISPHAAGLVDSVASHLISEAHRKPCCRIAARSAGGERSRRSRHGPSQQSQSGIAALAWNWKTRTADGRTTPSSTSMIGSGPSMRAPLSLDEGVRKLYAYWQVVLPG